MTFRPDDPHLFLQWKGTNACFDFYCPCGEQSHYDGYFAYAYRCPHCKAEFALPTNLPAIPLAEAPALDGSTNPPFAEFHQDQTSRLCGGFWRAEPVHGDGG